ncbi:PepSY-associated TM helix domain-containing protein [Novosphingobium umbonatum]|nr:PepSY-associated TM helix domain-containing protein [Novosphingobium umbonatum]
MQKLRYYHRLVMLLIVVFMINYAVTGLWMQGMDIRSYFTHAPASDPAMISLRESFNGPPNFEVIAPSDYSAAPLSAGADLVAMLERGLPVARAQADGRALRYVELRMVGGKPELIADAKPVAQPGGVKLGEQDAHDKEVKNDLFHINPVSGTFLRRQIVMNGRPEENFRNTIKGLHNFGYLQFASSVIAVLAGLGLLAMIVTGTLVYFKLLKARQKLKRGAWFWQAGGWWRTLHRGVSVAAALFLLVIAASGTYISFEGLFVRTSIEIYKMNHGGQFEWGPGTDASAPLSDRDLPAMLTATLAAQRATAPDQPVKVIRLRYYSTMAQGVVVSGTDNETQQHVYNTATRLPVTETEPGYPESHLPLGWQMHQWAKQVHRGDYLALPGSTVSGHLVHALAGLALLYLCLSGLEMYYSMWKKRRDTGRAGLTWK